MTAGRKPASEFTQAANAAVLDHLDFDDERDFADMTRGLIAPLPDGGVIRDTRGEAVFDSTVFDYVDGPAPDTVNPSLWRQSRIIKHAGLFQVCDRIYQVRNHDIANVTIVEGDGGLVIVDVGTTTECTRAAMELYYAHRPQRLPVVAVIYTHPHLDHYGGILAVTTPEDVAAGKVTIVAPGDFDRYAIGENVICGNVMSRRAAHAFGSLLPPHAQGFVSDGIGIRGGGGRSGYIPPTDLIRSTGEERVLAGLTFQFQMAPDTEAPEEMHLYIPELRALSCAENANHSLHNIQTLRGARTRDAANFARYLDEAIELWGADAEVHFGPHTWPVWGNENVTEFLASQRDTYKYLHDQTLRLANHGLTPIEIAESVELPAELGRAWWNRGYHGTVHHNVRAVYAKELGFYDGNPMHLFPLPDGELGRRYVDAIGGTDRVVALAREAVEAGEYRWAAELAGRAVYAEPGNAQARQVQADAYEQLGYQAEGPQWRNIFLTAAQELREGPPPRRPFSSGGKGTIAALSVDRLLDFVAVRLNGPQAADVNLAIDLDVRGAPTPYSLKVARGVLNHWRRPSTDPDLTLALDRLTLIDALFRPAAFDEALAAGRIEAKGDVAAFHRLVRLLDRFTPVFDLLGPHADPDAPVTA
ncbi:MBL fold metallo-hydrolase [Streptomyces sp. YC504]|uniref:MBL fold metallo-hydrolase n=1 Tax=Streptomyces mesophilus TaxID=1775132 RepID=A0A6G4X9T0_9ACTN|nr:alkyl sulfatase dimerization domain-containing protein [Streptomyces mesophilus]NGO74138.1 MBL fold metallo-hydrolase [Streptomyces mesophilus]